VIRWPVALAAAGLFGALASACSGASPRSDADLALGATVRVEAEGCSIRPQVGTGAFVAAHRVLTVAHVVAGAVDVDIVLSDGTEKQATVVAIDRRKDLAVLQVDAPTAPLAVGTMHLRSHGSFVTWRTGKATVLPFSASAFVDITASDIDRAGTDLRKGYQLDADVALGDSGSVLVSDGRAVAVIFARSAQHPGRGWATDIAEAAPLIATAGDDGVDVGGCSTGP
jgi:S1-C subfamily serine protease